MSTESGQNDAPETPEGTTPHGRFMDMLGNRIFLIVGAVVVAGLMSGISWVLLRGGEGEDRTLAGAIEAYETGEVTKARDVARSQVDNLHVEQPYQGAAPFLLGMILHDEAKGFLNPKDRETVYRVAVQHLETARDRGFPPEYEIRGEYLLGISQMESKQYEKAIHSLTKIYADYPLHQLDIENALADCYLAIKPTTPDNLQQALKWSRLYDAHPVLTPEQKSEAHIRLARIQFELGQLDETLETILEIPPTSPSYVDGVIVQGLVARRRYHDHLAAGENEQAQDSLNTAIRMFRKAASNQLVAADSTRKASYLLAVMLRANEQLDEAMEQASRTRKIYYRTPESVAAGLEEAELLRAEDKDEEAVEIYRRALREAALNGEYENPWVNEVEFRQRVTRAIDAWKSEEKFAPAVEVAQALRPLFPADQAFQIEADVQHAWGDYLEHKADKVPFNQSLDLRAKSRFRFRSAGKVYLDLAEHRFATAEYTNDLWNSASAYLRGQDFSKAVEILAEYQRYETREHQPRALVATARALIALDRAEDALSPINECLEFYPKDPSVYEARVLGGEAYMELGKLAEAKSVLTANLDDGRLEPSSREWQDSLFALGQVLHLEGEMYEAQARVKGALEAPESIPREAFQFLEQSNESYKGAIKYLHAAVRRYPDDPRSVSARYLIAECHRRSSTLPKKKFRLVNIETQRIKFDKEVKDHLESAIEIYNDLEYELTTKLEMQADLHPVEAKILRNCYFAQGAAMFELARYKDAIEAYSTASNRYQTEAVSLEAFVQIAHCYRYMNLSTEARGTVEQAKIVLSRLADGIDYSETTHGSRDDWQNYLDWLGATL
ncbi:tetratricopeptide repeat protein [Bremerella sp. P1]|uniref:tetratricopeptide repeat protein n=1 Tax=Bremerella sp. P1 TaxID=3026424 RepID=UPI0023681B40|nr:tetratricopeptide repeat protein [Bremerella sp. P1]WDI43053.1 tetratricopeptide repeat protein [Bremerella sp. P1]